MPAFSYYYKSIRKWYYSPIYELVEQTIANDANPLKEEVRAFLQQYATTLRRKIVPASNTNIAELARKIYLEHREAIDLIIQYKPDFEAETKAFFRQAIEEEKTLVMDREQPQFIRFRSVDWNRFDAFNTSTGWAPSQSVIVFEIVFGSSAPYLKLTLGPSLDKGIRGKIHASVLHHPEVFKHTRHIFTDTWTQLDRRQPILEASYLENWDAQTVNDNVVAWMADFAKNQFPAMNKVVVDCLEEYEAERKQS